MEPASPPRAPARSPSTPCAWWATPARATAAAPMPRPARSSCATAASSSGNSGRNGGGIHNAGTVSLTGVPSRTEITASVLSGNEAVEGSGGAVFTGHQGTLVLVDVDVDDNVADGDGGGVAVDSKSSLTITGGSFSGNVRTGLAARCRRARNVRSGSPARASPGTRRAPSPRACRATAAAGRSRRAGWASSRSPTRSSRPTSPLPRAVPSSSTTTGR